MRVRVFELVVLCYLMIAFVLTFCIFLCAVFVLVLFLIPDMHRFVDLLSQRVFVCDISVVSCMLCCLRCLFE